MRVSICFVLIHFISLNLVAQDDTFPESKMAVVILRNNEHIIGQVLENSDTKLLLVLRGNEKREFDKTEIRFYKVLDENDIVIKGKYMFPTSAKPGYFLTTNAFTLGNTKLSINGAYLTYTDLQIPISKSMDIGFGGILGAPLTTSFKAKFSIGSTIHMGIKTYASWASYFDIYSSMVAGQALFTTGNRERNITFGPGIGLLRIDEDNIGFLFSTFGLKSRISQKFSIVAEGMYGKGMHPSSQFLGIFSGMGGVQYHIGQRNIWSWGIGLVGAQSIFYNFWGIPTSENEMFPMFYYGFRKIFGAKK